MSAIPPEAAAALIVAGAILLHAAVGALGHLALRRCLHDLTDEVASVRDARLNDAIEHGLDRIGWRP